MFFDQHKFEIIHPAQFSVTDDGNVYFIYLDKPWKSASFNQKFYQADNDVILIRTDYSSDVLQIPRMTSALLRPANKIYCWPGMWSFNDFVLNSDGDGFHEESQTDGTGLDLYQIEINPSYW